MKKPFDGGTFMQVMMKVCQENPAPITSLAPSLTPALVAIVERCLQKEPSKRFQSAADLVQALVHVQRVPSDHSERQTTNRRDAEAWVPDALTRYSVGGGITAFVLMLLCFWFAHHYEASESLDRALNMTNAVAERVDAELGQVIADQVFSTNKSENYVNTTEMQALGTVISAMTPFDFFYITDRAHRIRVSTDPQLLDQIQTGSEFSKLLQKTDKNRVYAHQTDDGDSYFVLARDVLFLKEGKLDRESTIFIGVRPPALRTKWGGVFYLLSALLFWVGLALLSVFYLTRVRGVSSLRSGKQPLDVVDLAESDQERLLKKESLFEKSSQTPSVDPPVPVCSTEETETVDQNGGVVLDARVEKRDRHEHALEKREAKENAE